MSDWINLSDWMHDDICWCICECEHTDCFRHTDNRRIKTGPFTAAELKNTEYCPYPDDKEA